MTLTTERQQFEEWLKFHSDEEECTNLLQRNSAGTNYLHPHADLAWIAWQASRELLANREAQPVAYLNKFSGICMTLEQQPNAADDAAVYVPLYTAPPAPAVPGEAKLGEMPFLGKSERGYVRGWNDCRAAMLKGERP